MASFEDHIIQAKKNLQFLEGLNGKLGEYFDWQVTACFYVAVHLANAHIARKEEQHYRTHVKVMNSLSPFSQDSPSKVDEDTYTSYAALKRLSRRARYLVSDKESNKSNSAFLTTQRHLAKAFRHLDKFIQFISREYQPELPVIQVFCQGLSTTENFQFIMVSSSSPAGASGG